MPTKTGVESPAMTPASAAVLGGVAYHTLSWHTYPTPPTVVGNATARSGHLGDTPLVVERSREDEGGRVRGIGGMLAPNAGGHQKDDHNR